MEKPYLSLPPVMRGNVPLLFVAEGVAGDFWLVGGQRGYTGAGVYKCFSSSNFWALVVGSVNVRLEKLGIYGQFLTGDVELHSTRTYEYK